MGKVLTRAGARRVASRLRREGKRIVFTNGCFDVLHVGHVRMFRDARALGDLLVIGLNSDESVRRLKGPGRPVFPEGERAEVLCALGAVDYVVVFDEDTPYDLIAAVRPHVLVKGGDWALESIVGKDIVESLGGTVVRIRYHEGHSTSSVVERIKSASS